MSRRSKLWVILAVLNGGLLTLSAVAGVSAAVAGQGQVGQKALVAIVDGKEVTEQALLDRVRGELLKLETQIYDLKRRGVDDMIAEYVLERAALAQGLSTDQLLQRQVGTTVSEVTPKEVDDFYNANQARIRRPLEEVRGQIVNYLRQTKLDEARRAYVQSLREKAEVKVFLQPPVVEVSAEGAPFKGLRDAPITIVEFSDFQCPYCKRVLPVLAQVLDQYPGKVKLVFRDFPLVSIHPHASKAAEAAHCAGEQGKYWEYHDLLFDKQEAIPTADYAEYAGSLGMELTAFRACLNSAKYKAIVERNYADGMKAGVSGTPAFFINGRLLSGAQPFEAFKAVIDDELVRLGLQAQR